MLPRVPEWQIALVGALEARRAGDPELDAACARRTSSTASNHSGGVAIVDDARVGRRGGRGAREDAERRRYRLAARRRARRLARPRRRARRPARRRRRAARHARRRPRARLLHLGHHRTAEGGAARARLHLVAALHRRASGSASAATTGSGPPATPAGPRPRTACCSVRGASARRCSCTTAASSRARELELLEEVEPHVFCAPPTEYRLLVKEDLARLRAAAAARVRVGAASR